MITFTVTAKSLHRPVQRLRIERPDAVVLQDLLPVHPFAGLQNAEIVTQLVNEHPTNKGIERDALALVPPDDVVQPQSLVPIIDHQRRADGKRFIVIRRKLSRPQLGLFLHKLSQTLRTPLISTKSAGRESAQH
jgi:hypothetical protein